MTELENYLDKFNNNELHNSIFNKHQEFNYDDEDIFQIDLDFMLNNIYNIKITDTKLTRMGQQEFRQQLLELYDNKCIVSSNDCILEVEACHIIPVATEQDYSLFNGLLLERNIHKTFDKYLWSINPDTFIVETIGDTSGSIQKYNGKRIILNNNDELKDNLRQHYNKFLHYKKL